MTRSDSGAPSDVRPWPKDELPMPTAAPSPAESSLSAPHDHRSVTSFLMSHGLDVRREGVRVVAGFALLLVAGVVALNMTLWRNASHRIEDEAWRRLEAAADVQRADVDQTLNVFRRERRACCGVRRSSTRCWRGSRARARRP
jgi:hypothetical protein